MLDYPYFKKYIIVLDLGKHQARDVDPKAIQQIKFTGNLDWTGNTMFFVLEEGKKTIMDFSERIVQVL